MAGFLLRWIISGLLFMGVLLFAPGIFVDTLGSAMIGMACIGLGNALIRPVTRLLSLPCHPVALGGMTLVVNMLTAVLIIHLLPGFQVLRMLPMALGLVLITALSCMFSIVIQDR